MAVVISRGAMMDEPSENNRYRPVSIIFAIITTGAGVSALAGWLSGYTFLAGMASGWIPMAPSTALLFLLSGSAILLRIFLSRSRGAWLAANIMVSLCGTISFILFLLSSLGKHPALEHLGLAITGAVGTAPLGHISPVTAFCFVIAALSFLASASFFRISRRRSIYAWWLSFILIAVNAVFLLAYLYGSPFLYGGEFIPPAVTTILAFLALGAAQFTHSASKAPPLLTLNGTVKSSVRILLIIFAVLCCGILVAGYLYYRHFEQGQRTDIEKRLSAIADLKVNELILWRKERLGDADVIFGNPAFSSLMRHFLSDPGDRSAEGELKGWIGRIQSAYQYDRIYLIDNRNATRLAIPPSGAPPDPHLANYAAQALSSGKVMFTDFHRHDPKSPIHLSILVPVFAPPGARHPLGVLAFRIDPGRYLYPFMERWPAPSMSGETLLVRREGDSVVFLNSLRFNKDAALTMKLPMSRADLPAVNAVLGKEDIVEGRDYRGVAVVAALRHVPDSPWYMVAKLDKEEIYAPLRERLWFVIALTATLLISAGTGVGLVWRQQSAAFYKERFRAEQKRAESEERYRELVQNANSAIIRWSRDGTITFFNDYAQEFFGYAEDEAVGRPVDMLLPEQDSTGADLSGLIMDIVGHPERHQNNVNENLCRDGRRVWMTWTNRPILDESGGVIEILAIGSDITLRINAEEAMLASKAKLEAALESMTDAVFISDSAGRFIEFNEAFATFHKFRNKEECARSFSEYPAFLDVFMDNGALAPLEQWAVPRALRGETAKNAEYTLRRKDTGETWTASYSFAPIRDSNGVIVGSVVAGRDITDRKRQEEELREKNLELERLNYTVSHDLKSPLVTVKTFLGYLGHDMAKGDSARIEQDMMYMRNAAERMGCLLEDLFNLSRLGRTSYPPVDVEFGELAAEAIDIVGGRIRERGVQVELSDAHIMLHGDRRRLLQIWQNLIDNAVKYMGDQERPRLEVGIEEGKDRETVFFVKDNGQGIDPRYREKIFGLFEQLDPGVEGTGIGLALVKRIVELNGGALWMESEGPGMGSAFFFTLPGAMKNT